MTPQGPPLPGPARRRVVRHGAALAMLAAGLPVLAPATARAQTNTLGTTSLYTGGLLSGPGADTRNGDLRVQIERALRPPPLTGAGPAWQFNKSVGVSLGLTDNALRTQSPRRADAFVTLQPQIGLTGDTARAQVNLNYAPQVTRYLENGSQNRVDQFGDARANFILYPDLAFLDLRGSVTQQSLSNTGFNQDVTRSSNRQDQVQTVAFSATPYLERRIGGWGTARVGYSYARTLQDQQDTNRFNSTTQSNFNNIGYGAVGNLTTQRQRASFASGENLGRFNSLTTIEAVQYSGGIATYRGAYRNQANEQLGYAVTRLFTLIGGLGYQDIKFGGTPGYRVNEPTWNGGVRYNPNPDTSLTVLYGRRDGATSFSVDGSTTPTPRTRVIVRYSTGITSDAEEAQNLLETTSVGPTGLLTDTRTGAPVSGGSFSGVQNGIYRVRRASATVLFLAGDRDSYSLDISNEDRTTLTTSQGLLGGNIPAGTKTNSTTVSASWQHDLAPDMSLSASAQYGISNSPSQLVANPVGQGNQGNQRTISLSTSLTKAFTETLSGSVRYTYTDRSGARVTNQAFNQNLGQNNYTENLLLLSLRKGF